jgi:dTDP-4-dehydrorhamnose reductase
MVIAVTGASGQLGQALRYVAGKFPELQLHFATSSEADITDSQSIANFFDRINPDACINAAAYTAVDKAESEPEKAYAINVTGVANLANACKERNMLLVHISTDFVFDGTKNSPYTETDSTNPQSVYGKTKLQGEDEVRSLLDRHYIVRTSWVYSQFGNNFMKTMLRIAAERDAISVVNDQKGSPTNACDLAQALLTILQSNTEKFGTYHYSNEGECTWYDFAKKIFEINQVAVTVNPIPTAAYPTPACRPAYSVLDKTLIKRSFGLIVRDWKEGLISATNALHQPRR